MGNKKSNLKVGDIVFVIERNLEVVQKTILEVINTDKEIKYKLDSFTCGGVPEDEFHLTKHKAEAVKQKFLDQLKFRVGDLLVFRYKDYGHSEIEIGRVFKLQAGDKPYNIKTAYKNIYDLTDNDIVLKVNNEYIENFGKLSELDDEFEETTKQMHDVIKRINHEHELLEKDLKQSFKKQYKWNWNKKRPLFKNKFCYEEDEEDD